MKKGLELLEKHPLVSKVINEWFMQKMIESFKDDTVPDGFKQYMLEQGVENDKVGILIDENPRMLFDLFDEHKLYIKIVPSVGDVDKKMQLIFVYSIQKNLIDDKQYLNKFLCRKEAELAAIEEAFEMLEEKLGEERMNVIAQNGNTGEHYDEI